MLALVSAACSRGERQDAQPQHTWGETRRGLIPSTQGRPCNIEFSTTPEAVRLNALAARIVAANPQTFSDGLELSKMCIGVDPGLQVVDARTTPESLRVAFSRPLVQLAQTDGELAAVLSHELAHITLQHSGFSEFPPRMNVDPAFLRWKADAKSIQDQIVALATAKADPQKIFELNAEFAKILALMNQRIDEVYGESNAHLNWIEQEADEVGAELFIRAGFKQEDFVQILWTSHPSDAPGRGV
ncbi:MAG: Peptidase family [Pseudomonadota bacterium]